MEMTMKIHIIGASGSGKTFLAKQLSERLGIPAWELDELFWDNSAGSYNSKRSPDERGRMLEEILECDDWILEGVQHSWLGQAFAQADVICLLTTPPLLCRLRIVRRFFDRKWKKTGRKNETLRSLLKLLVWTRKFYRVNLPQIRAGLEPYRGKVVELKTKREIYSWLEKQAEGFSNQSGLT